MRTPDGTIVEGVVDLAFRNDEGQWVVVDFKTDAELVVEGAYALQVTTYVQAIAALGEPVARGVVLSV
jgi:ATP-dependent exoDNAse (exonuclease V) beta subunit